MRFIYNLELLLLVGIAVILSFARGFSHQPRHKICPTTFQTSLAIGRYGTIHAPKLGSEQCQHHKSRSEILRMAAPESDGDVEENVNIWRRIRDYFRGNPEGDGLTVKERLKQMGLATVLSYGFVSNVNSVLLTSLAWYVSSTKSRLSPLAPGQWKPFLGVYAGFYVISNFLRPIRVAAAVAVGPVFDQSVDWIRAKINCSKPAAITITVLLYNLVGTIVLMVAGISLASLLSGVPIWATKL